MGRFWENVYPIVLSAAITLILYVFGFSTEIKGFDNVIDGIITFASIVIGFLAALLAIILSISKSKVVQHLYEYVDLSKGKNILFNYFRQSILSGFIVVLLSICMYVLHEQTELKIWGKISLWGWTFLSIFFMLSAYRIISVLMSVLFIEAKVSAKSKLVQSNLMKSDDLNEFKKASSRD